VFSKARGATLVQPLNYCYSLNMRILITGDRHWRCDDLAEQVLNRLLAWYGPELVVVHGGAAGIDQSFSVAGEALGLNVEPHLADWKGLGNVAGPARNREMVEAGADLCIALHRTLATSKGTKDCICQALAAGIPVYLIEDDGAIPRSVQADDPRLARA
jgi:YspA, cpYpsA-related SLOG family